MSLEEQHCLSSVGPDPCSLSVKVICVTHVPVLVMNTGQTTGLEGAKGVFVGLFGPVAHLVSRGH